MNMSNLFDHVIGGRQFNFQPFNFGNESGYHVDVKDEDGTRWEFRLTQADTESWKLHGESLPTWITDREAEIIEAVNQHD